MIFVGRGLACHLLQTDSEKLWLGLAQKYADPTSTLYVHRRYEAAMTSLVGGLPC